MTIMSADISTNIYMLCAFCELKYYSLQITNMIKNDPLQFNS